jgi:hypothetical protein
MLLLQHSISLIAVITSIFKLQKYGAFLAGKSGGGNLRLCPIILSYLNKYFIS